MTKKTIALRLLFCFALFTAPGVILGGCNTVEGVGEDVESVGDGMQDAAGDK